MRRAILLVVGAALVAFLAVAYRSRPARPPPPPPVPVDALLDQGPAAVAPLMGTALGPLLAPDLERRALAELLRNTLQAGHDAIDLTAFGADDTTFAALDPAQPRGTPSADGKAALRSLDPPTGPLLVRAPAAELADYLAACVVRGAWCLVVDDAADPSAAWNGVPADVALAPAYVARAGAALPVGTVALWLVPDGQTALRVGRP